VLQHKTRLQLLLRLPPICLRFVFLNKSIIHFTAPLTDTKQVKYVLLDCDNTLCLSERLAFEACADLTNELLEQYGKPERYTVDKLLEEFVGQNFRGMMVNLQKIHDFQMPPEQLEEYVNKEVGYVTKKLSEKCTECPGATAELEKLEKQGYPMAVVSTSAKPRVVASLKKVGMDKFFPDAKVYSAATSLNPPSSKPDPKIYLFACEQLGVKPEECVTVEDSRSGATAAMRAGIPFIGYVGVYGIEDGKERMEQMAKTLKNDCKADQIMYDWKEFPELLAKSKFWIFTTCAIY
jgi:HAD superfamily hydrolase (TIGR01509 family)